MAVRKTTKKQPVKTKRDPSPAQLFNKVNAVSESTKALSKEIKGMAKIFKENQRVLVSMSDMMESLNVTMSHIQKQSKQIDIIEEDTQRLFSGLNQVRVHEKFITKLNKQTEDIDKKISKMPKTDDVMRTISESKEAIKNNSKMIMKIANRVDEVKDKMDKVPTKGQNDITGQIEELRESIKSITSRTGDIGKDMSNLKNEIGGLVSSPKISSLIGDGMKTFKSEIEEKISNISNMINRSDQLASEFHQKTDKVMHELQGVKGVTNKASDDSSKEVMAILKLNEYQSSIRMQAE